MEIVYNSTIIPIVEELTRSVPMKDICVMLAEEASELAQAASKMYRQDSDAIPTPIEYDEAMKKLIEEYTDVIVAASVMRLQPSSLIFEQKAERWLDRIAEKTSANTKE